MLSLYNANYGYSLISELTTWYWITNWGGCLLCAQHFFLLSVCCHLPIVISLGLRLPVNFPTSC